MGFMVLDAVADRLGAAFGQEKYQGLVAKAAADGESLLLVKPLTFMNNSGDCVARAARNNAQSPEDVLIVVDDVNLPLGKMRFRKDGSAGGHNGLKSIIERLGTDAFPRLRIGVGAQDSGVELVDHVLGRFAPDEKPVVEEMVTRGADAVRCFWSQGVARAMNEFNR
jgi:PTH1 family peptidyl-tRNA hydrolase